MAALTTKSGTTGFATTGRSRRGEPLIWLAAGGLALGVMMAAGLLLLILAKGAASFWPKQIEVFEIREGASVIKMSGYVTQQTERKDATGAMREELQIFRANRDVYGEAFRYFDRKAILSVTRPESVLWIERLEFGPAIAEPVALETPAGRISANDPMFLQRLDELLARADTARAELLQIERKQIGANSREMEAIERAANRGGSLDPAAADRRLQELQAEFLALQAKAADIRAELSAWSFVAKTVDEREMTYPAEKLLHVFAPNRAGWWGRLGEMLQRMGTFLSTEPREANTEGGVFPAIFGTVIMTLVMSLFVTPFGVIAAIYLREYAKQGWVVRMVRICVNNLAGVPSIVFGVFGLAFFVYFVGGTIDSSFYADKLPTPTFGTPGMIWASLTLALLTLPVVIVATEEALSAVPRGVREAALACGASKWQTIQRIVLPASLPGILTGVILAMARGAGEVAPLMLVGVVKLAPTLVIDDIAPFIHPERKFMHLGFHIYDLGFQSPDAEAAKPVVYATALLLICVVVALNLTAILIRNRLKKRFAVSSF
jgi:phosphate transport system permease protein